MSERQIALDTETTGFKPEEGHRIVEIGCVELENFIPTGEVYHVYTNPQRDMPTEAFNVHGLSTEFLASKPLFNEIAGDFLEFVGTSPLVIHNAAFDMAFLNAELRWDNREELQNKTIDTLSIARKKFPSGSNSLDALCRRFNIDASSRHKHGALIDAELLAEVYLELIGGRQQSLGLLDEKKRSAKRAEQAVKQRRERRNLTLITDEERRAHLDFVEKKLGDNPIWKQMGRAELDRS